MIESGFRRLSRLFKFMFNVLQHSVILSGLDESSAEPSSVAPDKSLPISMKNLIVFASVGRATIEDFKKMG